MITKLKKFFIPIAFIAMFPFSTFAQDDATKRDAAPNNWYQLDRNETGYYGISLDKAYDFLKNKKSKTVIVGVIDSGVDTLQEDLKPVLWHNPGETPKDNIDNGKNGYTDDFYGWNFIGGKDGTNIHEDSYEAARVYWKLKPKYDSITDSSNLSPEEKTDYATFLRAKQDVVGSVDPTEFLMMERILPGLERGDSIIAKDLGKSQFT
jgi:hypothetical protein